MDKVAPVRVRTLVLDFDGIVVESVAVKTHAFRELFKHSARIEEIIKFHLENDGLSRYKKFAHIYGHILREPLSSVASLKLGERFTELVFDEILRCPDVPGVIDFLEKVSERVKVYVASGTPEEELREIVRVRGLQRFFTGVYGTPAIKSEIIAKIMKDERVDADEVLFLGDTMTDFEEAQKVGVRFIGRISHDLLEENPLQGLGVQLIHDFIPDTPTELFSGSARYSFG